MRNGSLEVELNNEKHDALEPDYSAREIQIMGATEILGSARALWSVAKISNLPMIAYFLSLVVIEAQDFLKETGAEE